MTTHFNFQIIFIMRNDIVLNPTFEPWFDLVSMVVFKTSTFTLLTKLYQATKFVLSRRLNYRWSWLRLNGLKEGEPTFANCATRVSQRACHLLWLNVCLHFKQRATCRVDTSGIPQMSHLTPCVRTNTCWMRTQNNAYRVRVFWVLRYCMRLRDCVV